MKARPAPCHTANPTQSLESDAPDDRCPAPRAGPRLAPDVPARGPALRRHRRDQRGRPRRAQGPGLRGHRAGPAARTACTPPPPVPSSTPCSARPGRSPPGPARRWPRSPRARRSPRAWPSGDETAQLVAAVTIAAGLLFLLMAVFRMGWIAQFLSRAVITGFLFGAAIDVVVGELAKISGTETDGENVWQELRSWIDTLGEFHTDDLRRGGRGPGRHPRPALRGPAGPGRARPGRRRPGGVQPARPGRPRASPPSATCPGGCPSRCCPTSTW